MDAGIGAKATVLDCMGGHCRGCCVSLQGLEESQSGLFCQAKTTRYNPRRTEHLRFPPGAYVPATVPAQALRSVDWPVVRVVNHRQTTAVGWVLAASFISVRSA